MHAVEHIGPNEASKEVHTREIRIFPVDFANSRCHKEAQTWCNPCDWKAGEAVFGVILH